MTALTYKFTPRFTIAIISAIALAYEILLARLFAIIQWHHFAYMIISLALLGYGISGSFLSLTSKRILDHYPTAFIVNIVLFGVSILCCFLVAQQIPFNAEEILWDWQQSGRLFIVYLLLMLPFFFVANAIGLTFMAMGENIARIYAADMMGAGIGSILVIGLLFYFMPNNILQLLSCIALFSALIAWLELKLPLTRYAGILLALLVLPWILPANWLALSMSPYKALPQALRIDGTNIVSTQSSPLVLIHVVESKSIPFRHAPGLSLNATSEPPPQLAVFSDGDNMSVINKNTENPQQLQYLDQQTSAVPYHLSSTHRVLILGSGTGSGVLQALNHSPDKIEAVELNPQVAALLTEQYTTYSGNIFHRPEVSLHIAEARGFVASSDKHYDIIQLTLLDAFGASSAGLYALNESYLYTVEAFEDYISALTSDGYLTVTRWIKLPPRDNLKMFATAIAALRQTGVSNPQKHVLLIRSWQTASLLVKKSEITAEDINRLRHFCKERGFDLAYYPGMHVDEANQFNILRKPLFFEATTELIAQDTTGFYERYKFNIKPATDNQPYFFNFFKWPLLGELIELKDQGGMPLIEWGYIVLIITLVQALTASLVLIFIPILFSRKASITKDKLTLFSLFYFFAIGLAFLFIEIAFIQKLIIFLHHPLYAIAVCLSAFLLFAGAGSYFSKQFIDNRGYKNSINLAVVSIIVLGFLYTITLNPVFDYFLSSTIAVKFLLAILIIAPLAFFMGMPFPLALSFLSESRPTLIPWVWSVNGCASVISAILAMILAMQFGFNVVIIAASACYLLAMLVSRRLLATYITQ